MNSGKKLAEKKNIPVVDNLKIFKAWYESNPEFYEKKLMMDSAHLNEVGNAVMGLSCARFSGLPDPLFQNSIKNQTQKTIKKLIDLKELPPKCSELEI